MSIEQFGSVADNFIYKPEPRITALKPFQVRAAKHMVTWAATINGMATGLGKTCSTIATIDTLDLFPAVIVCGSRVALQWAGEFIHWLKLHAPLRPDLTVSLLEGESPRPFENRYIKTLAGDETVDIPINDLSADVKIVTYSIVHDWAAAIAARSNRVLVMDECFPYGTLIDTDQGPLAIGQVVENKLTVKVRSVNLHTGMLEWKRVSGWFRNSPRTQFVRVKHEHGSFVCTPNHQIWTEEGYVRAGDLTPNHTLRYMQRAMPAKTADVLQHQMQRHWVEEVPEALRAVQERDVTPWPPGEGVLQSSMRLGSHENVLDREIVRALRTALYAEVAWPATRTDQILWLSVLRCRAARQKETNQVAADINLRAMQTALHTSRLPSQSILQSELRWSMASEFAGTDRDTTSSHQAGTQAYQEAHYETSEEEIRWQQESGLRHERDHVSPNDNEQSNSRSRLRREDKRGVEGEAVSGYTWGEWPSYASTASGPRKCLGVAHGSDYQDPTSLGSVSGSPSVLQGGHGAFGTAYSSGGGWILTQHKQRERARREEGQRLERSRVVSVEIYESGSDGESGRVCGQGQRVYDIEVDGNHNYFANGVLVSNCHRVNNVHPRVRGNGYPVIGTRQAVACWYLARHVVPTYYFQHIYGLSADAVVNRPKDLTGILEILGVMWRLGGREYFRERYCNREGKVIFGKDGHLRRYWDDNGASNLEELHHRLTVLGLLFRVTKKEALPDMPANTEITIPVTLSNQEQYDRAEAGLLSYIREMALIDRELNERLEAMNLEQLIIECEDLRSKHPRALGPLPENPDAPALRAHLLQATAHSKQYQAAKAQALVRLTTLRRLVGEGKVEAAIEWLRDFADENPQEKVILFSHHRPVQNALFRAFPGAARITGGQTSAQSDENKHRLQRDPNCTTCLISNEAGGEGLNCSASRHTGILEWPWHRKGINQQIGRSNGRMDNPHEVNVYYFHAAGTIDDDVRRIVYQKGRMASIILDGKEPDDESLSRDISEELLAALVEKQR